MTMFLCGDVMTGRGVDQILPHPGDPELREAYVRDAAGYVALAEAASGPIPRPVITSPHRNSVTRSWPTQVNLPSLAPTSRRPS